MDDRSFVAGQAFILEAKKYWTTAIYPALKADTRRRARAAGHVPRSVDAVRRLIGETTLYRYYGWLERHLQRFKYCGRYGLVPYHRERRSELLAPLAALADDPRLELDPELEMPKYYQAVDIHQHPGGVWRDDFAAFVYERGARSTTPMLGGRHRDCTSGSPTWWAARRAASSTWAVVSARARGRFTKAFPGPRSRRSTCRRRALRWVAMTPVRHRR